MVAESFDITIHIQKENRIYRLAIPHGAPFEECFQICKELGEHVTKMQEKAKEQAEKQEAEKKEAEKEAPEADKGEASNG